MTKSWKWLKRVLWGLLTLIVLLFLTVSILVYFINSESYLEDYLSENLGVEATVGELDVSLLGGTVNIKSSYIGPKNNPYIQFESLEGELDYSNLWSSQLTVELLRLNNAKIRYPFEFKFKETDNNPQSESSSLPFDFIDVAAIDINNLDFRYEDDVIVLAKGANIKVRNIPVAESGFFLFQDLERFVKASQTTVEASLKSLQSNKTQLNNLRLSAYIEKQQLIIEEVKSGQSSINIDLVNYSQSKLSQQNAVSSKPVENGQAPAKQADELDLPFNDVVVQKIDLGKTDLVIQDKEELSIDAIQAEFSELLLVKDKKALWLDWPDFYRAQNSHFQISSNSMKSNIIDFTALELKGQLLKGQFIIPAFVVNQPVIKVFSDPTASTKNNSTDHSDNSHWYLPFESVILQHGAVKQGRLELTQGEEKHQVKNVDLDLTNTPLVVEHEPVFVLDKLEAAPEPAVVRLKNAVYSGVMGTVENISSQLILRNSSLTVKSLNIESPNIKYQASLEGAQNSRQQSTNPKMGSLPVTDIVLNQLTVNDAELDFKLGEDSYAGKGLDFQLNTIPLYEKKQWVVAQPSEWKEQADLTLKATTLTLPQGSMAGLLVNSSLDKNQLTVSELKLSGADLAINADDASTNTKSGKSGSTGVLPIGSVDLENIDLKKVDLDYRNGDIHYQLTGGDLSLSYYPLIKKGRLVSEPISFLQGKTNHIRLNAKQIKIPQGIINGLSTSGQLRDKDLMLDYLRTDSADIDIALTEETEVPRQSQDTESTLKEAAKEISKNKSQFALRTVKIGDLKLNKINLKISQPSVENDGNQEQLLINNLYAGATELMLAKNYQTIDQWYGSQLENAFTLVALRIEHIKQNQNDIRDLTITAVQNNQTIKVQPLRLTYNESPLSARWVVDLSQQPYLSTYQSNFKNLSLESLIEPANEKAISMIGTLDGDIDVSFQGLRFAEIFSSINGSIAITNTQPVTLRHLNVNKVLRSFLDSQSFGLLDIGGFLLAGPLGLLASQGLSLQDTLSQLGADEGDTVLSHVNIDMDIEKGVLITKDVAAATGKYRFAFNGKVNLAQQKFQDFRFDVINEKGCSEYGQTLNGNLTSPDIETATAAFDAVTGSIVGLFKQGVGLITGGACSAVYEGVVPHPEDGAEIIPKEQQRTIDPNAPEEVPETEDEG